MAIEYIENRYPELQEAVKLANEVLLNPEFYKQLAEIKTPFSLSKLNGEQLAPILKKHVDLGTKIYVKTFYPSWRRRWFRNNVIAYVDAPIPTVINYNSTKLSNSGRSIEDMAATIVHEYVHCADTLDPGDSHRDHGHGWRYAPNSAPYVVQRIAYALMSGAAMPPPPEAEEIDEPENLTPPPLHPLNFIAVNSVGDYAQTGLYRSSHEDTVTLVEHVRSRGIKKLVLYFHGGLVDERDAAKAILGMQSEFAKEESAHVVGFIWNTDILSSLEGNLKKLLDNGLATTLIKLLVTPILARRFNGLGELTDADIESYLVGEKDYSESDGLIDGETAMRTHLSGLSDDELRQEAERDAQQLVFAMDNRNDSETDALWVNMPPQEILDEEVFQAVRSDFDANRDRISNPAPGIAPWSPGRVWLVASILYKVYRRYAEGLAHGPHATVVEEVIQALSADHFLRAVWNTMKKNAATMWESGKPGGDLLAQLTNTIKGGDLSLELIGHSAGSECIAGLIEAFPEQAGSRPVRLNNCVLLAPATNYSRFERSYIAHAARYGSLCIFMMHDRYELSDNLINFRVLKYLYPASLLYLVSGVMEESDDTPLVGMDRFLRGKHSHRNVDFLAVKTFLEGHEPGKSVIIFRTPEDGSYQVTDHGDFDNDGQMLSAIRVLVMETPHGEPEETSTLTSVPA